LAIDKGYVLREDDGMTLNTLHATPTEPNRDRWGRPLIHPADGGQPIAYTRVTTLAKTLEEQSALALWKQRMTLLGAVAAPHILLAASAHKEDKKRLNALAEEALNAAQAGAKATIGTAMHAITETIDRGGDPGKYPVEYRADVNAYVTLRQQHGLVARHIEQFVVVDELQAAGTADLVDEVTASLIAPDGSDLREQLVINDKKTGSIDYSGMAIAIQLSLYSRGQAYDVASATRTPLIVNQKWGLVTHLPAGEGRASLHWVDLEAGWSAAQECLTVRNLRKRKDWMREHAAVKAVPGGTVSENVASTAPPSLQDQITAAVSREELTALWSANESVWSPADTELVKARLAVIAVAA
jgi:hypothetical protein